MESSFLNTFFFLASFLMCLKLILSSRNSKTLSNRQLPPGNTGLPFVGETLQFSLMGRRGTPEKFFMDRMKKHSHKVFKTALMGKETFVFCGASGNKFIFTNEKKLVSVSWPSTIKNFFPYSGTKTLAAANETMMRLRGVLGVIFNPDGLQKCADIIDTLAKEHLKNHWEGEKEVNVLSLAKLFTFTVSCKLILNVEDLKDMKDLADLFQVVVPGIFSIPINFPGTAYYRGIKASNSIREKLSKIMRQRKNDLELMDEKSDTMADYLSYSLRATDDDGKLMTEHEIMDHLLAVFLGSTDSATSAITCTIKYLAEYPHIYDQVLKEQRSIAEEKPPGELLSWKDLQKMKYTWNVVCEVLRLMPAMQGGFREALNDFSYSNFFIPKGSKLYYSANSTHRNPEYFPEPEKFDPSRFERTGPIPYAYIPFGGGSRICPGKDIGRMVMLIFIHNVVGKFRWEMLIPNEKIVVLPVPFPAKGLPVRLYPN